MKKLMLIALCAASSLASLAAEKVKMGLGRGKDGRPVMRVQHDPATDGMNVGQKMQYYRMKYTGGELYDVRCQKGSVQIVNAQKAADKAWFRPLCDYLEKENIRLRYEVKDGEFKLPNPSFAPGVAVFVVDDPSLPMSLVAPESRWAMMNVAPLKAGEGAKPQFFKARVEKQLMRMLCYVMGAANSQYPMCLLGPVTKPEDLDQFCDTRLPVDVLGKFIKYTAGLGLTPSKRSTYKAAVHEGWAHAPTNKFQQAIWDSIHVLPTKPITIEPEKK